MSAGNAAKRLRQRIPAPEEIVAAKIAAGQRRRSTSKNGQIQFANGHGKIRTFKKAEYTNQQTQHNYGEYNNA